MEIAGLTRLSTCDWPGKLVATVFLQGCPLACGYCHNHTIIDSRTPGVVDWGEVVDLLARRRGLLDGVVFSGGEPTRQRAVIDAARQVKEMGFGVGLHTAGPYPRVLADLLPLCDWVGLDIKALPRQYAAVAGVDVSGRAWESLRLAVASGVDLQVRTTVDRVHMTDEDVVELTQLLRAEGVADHVLQTVRTEGAPAQYVDRM